MALSTNLIEYWKMENTSGELSSYNLTSNGTPTEQTGIIGNGRQYASGSYDIFTHQSAVPAGTFSFWFKFSSINAAGRLINKTQVSVTDAFITYIDATNKFSVVIDDSANLNTNQTTLSTNTLYHYVITWDGTNVITYKNGSVETSAASTKTLKAVPVNFAIGGTPINAQYINGLVDEVGFWSRALTSAEVASLYNSGAGNQYPFSGGGVTVNSGFFAFF